MRYLAALSLAALAILSPCRLLAAIPANDTITAAMSLSANQTLNRFKSGDITGVTADRLDMSFDNPLYNGIYSYRDVWFKWTAPMSGTLSIQAVAANAVVWGVTVLGPAVQPVYTVVAFDDFSTSSSASNVWTTNYSFDVTPGTTYFNALWFNNLSAPTAYTYVQSFAQDPISDDFATRSQLGGIDFTVIGNNGAFTKEDNEPDHSSDTFSSIDQSAWMTWRSPDSRKSVTLTVQSKIFAPIIAVYTGDALATLKRVARSTVSTNRDGSIATLTFVAEDGIDYHIAVDGSKKRSGPFSMSLKATTARPGFVLQPVATIVTQGETAVFTAAAAYTGDTVDYQWERLPAGSSQWVPLTDDETFNGTNTSTLGVLTSLVMNNDRYRVKATDSVATSTSRTVLLSVTEFPALSTEVLGTIGGGSSTTLNLASGTIPAPTNGGTYFATGLPKGLSIDPATGEITGVITAKPGTYKVVYGSTDGKIKNSPTFIVQIVVAPFSSFLQGSFEALLTSPDALVLPEGKLTIKVAPAGSFTGTYFSLDDAKSYPFRGNLVLNQDTRTAGTPPGTPVSISRGKVLSPLQLNFSIVEPSGEGDSVMTASLLNETDTLLAQSFDGVHLGVFNTANPAAWAGTYTGLLSDAQKTDPASLLPIPDGDGSVLATVTGKSGIATLRGRSAEGVQFTGKLSSSADGSYRIAQRLFSGIGGHIAGSFKFNEQLTSIAGAYNVPEDGGTRVYVRKPEFAKDRVYPLGYATLSYLFNLEPWAKPGTGLLPQSLGLAEGGAVTVEIDAPGVSNMGANERSLPVNLSIGTNGKVVVTDFNTSKLTLSINATNGSFTGSFIITDPATPPAVKPVSRKVTLSGALLQKTIVVEGVVIGSGYLLLPPLPGDADNTVKSGTFKILAGATSLPF